MSSPFLAIPASEWVASNDLAFAIRDRYPVSPGHTLIIPRRLVANFFETTPDERLALLALVDQVKAALDAELSPDGYNVGFNSGEAAGQTVFHLHIHVIPRFRGDMDDPRGGVRHVIPARGNYLRTSSQPLATGGAADPFLGHLQPLFARAHHIAIVAAFVQNSGLELLYPSISLALARGARIQILTGDYLAITEVIALQRLLDWAAAEAARTDDDDATTGAIETRVVEVEKLATARSFHPKSWRFEGPNLGVAFVGSSNVSRTALGAGVEWNLRVDRDRDPAAFTAVVRAFDALWTQAQPLTADWIARYAERVARAPAPLPPGEAEEPLRPPPTLHEIQQEALAELARSRAEGRQRALVVLATGLGKTWLAAFDTQAFGARRVLFLAHRAELLRQAADTFRRLLHGRSPPARFGWYAGDRDELTGDVVLASIQKLARAEGLARLDRLADKERFDYVIVDEVHHAHAPTYRRLLAHLSPGFLLGLTATPDRADEGDILGLFDDHLAYRADVGAGIQARLLVPFAYFGIRDNIDYENIPWRDHRFDPALLSRAAQTERRMEQLWAAWNAHPGTRTLVFCCSIPHAIFARDWLRARGVQVEAVHSQPDSADRAAALDALAAGQLHALCAVDLFNEGVDVPLLDRVVLLRPTESPVVFLQQLGRGLRTAPGKERLTVIDFVGNHRVFLGRLRTLLSLAEAETPLESFLRRPPPVELPAGCSVDIELEAIALLEQLLPRGRAEVERAYHELHDARGERPTAGELFRFVRLGQPLAALRASHGGWFDFVRAKGHLTPAEERVFEHARAWFQQLETTEMSKCFKMVVLEVLLEANALRDGMELAVLAERSLELLLRSPELARDLEGVKELPDPRKPDPRVWLSYWKKNPVKAWTTPREDRDQWFELDGSRFRPRLPIPAGEEAEATFAEMTRELVDYQLARYRRRQSAEEAGAAFECRVDWRKHDPVLQLPSRHERPDLPRGETAVRLEDGTVWRFRFREESCAQAAPVGARDNQLVDLLRRWFGPAAGRPGTDFHVRFYRSPDGWWVEPLGARVVALPERGRLIAFPTLRAAAGAASTAAGGTAEQAPEAEPVLLPAPERGEELFAVRADGDSMDGGEHPIHDGDWLVLRYARGVKLGAVEGRVALVQVAEAPEGFTYQVKRVVRDGRGWRLRSDNPGRPSYAATEETVPLATLVRVVPPEALAPPEGTVLEEAELAGAFHLSAPPPARGRVDGHLFLRVEGGRAFGAPDRLRVAVANRRPGETAYVLLALPGTARWRYRGVARWSEAEGAWSLPALDYATWRQVGGGRSCSRTLPAEARARAEALVERALREVGPGGWLEHGGRRCRLVGPASQGGLRIDGGPGGFQERTLSLVDLGWALLAADEARAVRGLADEVRVNRLRYIEGTPKGATRWIDTGWALVVAGALGARDV